MRQLKKRTTLKEDAGKLLLDFGKLVFGGLFLGGVLRGEIPQALLAIGGFTAAIILCMIGLFLASKEKKDGEEDMFPEKQE